MKYKWKKMHLKDLAVFKNGKKRPQEIGAVPVYGGNGILAYTIKGNFNECISIGRVGAYCGNVCLSKSECWISDNAIAAIPNVNVSIEYLYYLLKNLHLNEMRIGSGQPLLTQGILNMIEVDIPEKEYQNKIIAILESIDNKIEINNELNKNLESQAQAIYRNMFEDNGAVGFESGILSDIADITMGQSPKGDTYNEIGEGTIFYQGRAEFGSRFPTKRLFTTDPKRMAEENDVLMSVRAPVGDINIARENCCIGRGLAAIRSKFGYQSFILYTMYALREQIDIFNGEGTVFGSINRDGLNSLSVQIPSKDLISRFEELVAPMDSVIRNNHEENIRLAAIRDALLPRLMSGEIDVSTIELGR